MVTASTIVALVAACIVVAALIFALWAIGFAQKSPLDTRLGDVSSQNSSSARSSSSDEAAKNDEAKRATADAQQALNALAADEDSRFLDCVQEFVDAYDSVVDEKSYSLADLDIDASDLAPRLRSEFECKVVQADVYNGMAWVDIDVTSKNIASAVDSFAREVAGDALSYDDEDAYRAHLKEALLDSIDKQKPRTVRVLLTLEQGDDAQTTEAVGREFLLNHAPYTVAGVVKDVSTLANTAYAQVWVPYTSTEITKDTWSDEHMGMMSVTILAKSREDFPAIREETERRRQEYNTIIGENGYSLIYRNRPYDQEKSAAGMAANIEPDVDQARRQRLIIFIILLIVPAINLSSMTQSRLRQRVAEIGVRRAFGSTRLELMRQIIAENLVVTLLAGILGLLLSVVFAYLGNTLLFAQEFSQTLSPPAVDASILLHGSTFGWALLFCFVLNLLSSGIPAWRASRVGIVNALGGRLHK